MNEGLQSKSPHTTVCACYHSLLTMVIWKNILKKMFHNGNGSL